MQSCWMDLRSRMCTEMGCSEYTTYTFISLKPASRSAMVRSAHALWSQWWNVKTMRPVAFFKTRRHSRKMPPRTDRKLSAWRAVAVATATWLWS